MCGRIVRERADYAEQFGFWEESETAIVPRFNIAPTQMDLIVRLEEDGRRHLEPSRWGLIPMWAKDKSIGSKMFNARAETLAEKPSFRNLLNSGRCIIPATGFFEWQRDGSRKIPLYIHRRDGAPIAFAGLWTVWHDPEHGETLTSHTVITCEPNTVMAAIHNRMPVILDRAGVGIWLDRTVVRSQALTVLGPCPDGWLDTRPVGTLVNSVRNEGPELIAPAAVGLF